MSADTDPSDHTRPADEDFVISNAVSVFGDAAPGVIVGPGDDAAVFDAGAPEFVVESCDCAVEEVHFRRRWLSHPAFGARAVGLRAVLCAASDIAAMGAEPKTVLLSLGLPPGTTGKTVCDILDGAREAAALIGAAVVGGNTSGAPVIFADVKVTGFTKGRVFVRNRGAEPGDDIFVTGLVAEAAAEMRALDTTENAPANGPGRFSFPEPRVAAGLALCGERAATAMTDTSDGLLADTEKIASLSGAGASLFLERVPVCGRFSGSAEEAVTAGGDYELVFTARPRMRGVIEGIARRTGVRMTRIGEVTPPGAGRIRKGGGEVARERFASGGHRHGLS
ncbi:MAG: thiamine-phosphate kinase [Candidatus Dadabacteria bacterium]|nr:thiamine-phosphate kinase [Candidatus Dadabacteria bacterium]